MLSQKTIWNEVLPSLSWKRSWHTKEDNAAIWKAANTMPQCGVAVEIGSAEGQSTITIALAQNFVKVHAIDMMPTANLLVNLKAAEVNDRVVVYPCKSEQAAKWFDQEIDFLFIDATHTADAVKQDIDLWSPCLKVGGYIAFHDYHESHVGMIEAIDEKIKNNPDYEGSLWGGCVFVAKKLK